MRKFLLIVGLLLVAVGTVCWFSSRTTTLGIEDSFAVNHTNPLKHPCGALTDAESLGRFGISNVIAEGILSTNDFSKKTWLFSNLPVSRIRLLRESRMLFLVPSNGVAEDKLYFVAVRRVPRVTVKLASPDIP